MATTTRPFSLPAPTTAAEARALADQLGAQESALVKAQRLASDEAMFTTAEQILAVDAVKADAARNATQLAWGEASADPTVGLEALFQTFVAMKAASAVRASIVSQASSIMGQIRPLRNENSGQPQSYRNDGIDYLARDADWSAALEGVVTSRAQAQAGQAGHDTQARCASAGETASAKVKV